MYNFIYRHIYKLIDQLETIIVENTCVNTTHTHTQLNFIKVFIYLIKVFTIVNKKLFCTIFKITHNLNHVINYLHTHTKEISFFLSFYLINCYNC